MSCYVNSDKDALADGFLVRICPLCPLPLPETVRIQTSKKLITKVILSY